MDKDGSSSKKEQKGEKAHRHAIQEGVFQVGALRGQRGGHGARRG